MAVAVYVNIPWSEACQKNVTGTEASSRLLLHLQFSHRSHSSRGSSCRSSSDIKEVVLVEVEVELVILVVVVIVVVIVVLVVVLVKAVALQGLVVVVVLLREVEIVVTVVKLVAVPYPSLPVGLWRDNCHYRGHQGHNIWKFKQTH